jgi:hypothetical protein
MGVMWNACGLANAYEIGLNFLNYSILCGLQTICGLRSDDQIKELLL